MIYDALKLMQVALENYIKEVEPSLGSSSQNIVVLDNIAMADDLGGSRSEMQSRIVVSLINIQEETTLRNSPYYHMENGQTVYQKPPVNLNLFVLFSILYAEYETTLQLLARVIEFFQWKKEFSFATTPAPNGISKDVHVLTDLYTLNFDQLNHLWGVLGGKQVPFVMYRMRLVALSANKPEAKGTPVSEGPPDPVISGAS